MSTKLKLAKLTWPTGAVEISDLEGLAKALPDYMKDSDVGDEWTVEMIEMEQEAYDNLPEFMGP